MMTKKSQPRRIELLRQALIFHAAALKQLD